MAIGNPITLTNNVAFKTISVTATADQTLFTVTGGYRINQLAVFRNGVRLADGADFTARDGSSVTLLTPANLGDNLEFQVFDDFRVADAIATAAASQTINGDLTVTGNLLGASIGIGTASTNLGFNGFSYLGAPFGATVNFAVTVAAKTAAHRYNGTGSSNGYVIDDVESPFLTLTPGRTYRFTLSSGDMTSHPFRFYLEADKTTAYTTNVTSTATYTEIVVTDSTPQVLHYQCSAHGYMGNSVQTNSNIGGGFVVADESSDTTCFPLFATAATGTALAAKSGTNLTFNSSSGALTATSFVGALTGNADTATNASGLSGTPDIAIRNITGVAATFTGVVTYEDVTNIDSVGIITARSDVSIADKIVHTGDTNTAIRFPAADTFTVETAGSERLRITSAGKVLSGNYFTSQQIGSYESSIQIQGTDSNTASMSIFRYTNDDGGANFTLGKGRGTSGGSVTKPNSGDALGAIRWVMANNNNLTDGESAKIECNVDAAPGGGDYPSRLSFYTTSDAANSVTERLRITSAGNVGINETTPQQQLHVHDDTAYNGIFINGNSAPRITFARDTTTTVEWGVGVDGTDGTKFCIAQAGNTAKITLDTSGNFTAVGNVTAYSDITLKENIETIPNALDKVLNLRGVEFDRIDKEDNTHEIGVIAQEVEEVIPEVVLTNTEGIKSVAYGNLVGLLIESIKELKAEINDLKAQVEG